MNWLLIVVLCAVFAAELLLSPRKPIRYQNVDALWTAAVLAVLSAIAVIVTAFLGVSVPHLDLIIAGVQFALLVLVKVIVLRRSKKSKYIVPPAYTSGSRGRFVSAFYKQRGNGPFFELKQSAAHVGVLFFISAALLFFFFIIQPRFLSDPNGKLSLPLNVGTLISLFLECGVFLSGESRLSDSLIRFRALLQCRTPAERAAVRYARTEDYAYLFLYNNVTEYPRIVRSSKHHYRETDSIVPIKRYNFTEKKSYEYTPTQTNPALEQFIVDNGLTPNKYYCAVYSLLNQQQNVMLSAPSYVDFEPYLAALIKLKTAKTESIVLIVNTEERQYETIKTLTAAFDTYFGFEPVPVFRTLRDWHADIEELESKKLPDSMRYVRDEEQDDEAEDILYKTPDVVVVKPDDVCDTKYVQQLRETINHLGLIIYYDFHNCVQEEPLFAKIVHKILDHNDLVSTLYMADGFFDLEQTLDNFFSARDVYHVTVPRPVPKTSYTTVWVDEELRDLQYREITDAARNFGSHIAVLHQALNFTKNDALVVADEFDAYAENLSTFGDDEILGRMDCHVGGTNVSGGNSVFCTVSDTYNNIPHAYLSMRGVGKSTEYINVISRPYLLRPYLAYYLKYFSTESNVLTTFSSGLLKTARSVAAEAVVLAFVAGCTYEQLDKYAKILNLEKTNPRQILNSICNLANAAPMQAVIRLESDDEDRLFIDESTYRLVLEASEFIRTIRFHVRDKVIVRPYRNYRYLVKNQKIVLDGIKYTVLDIEGEDVQLIDSNNRDPVTAGRTIRTCCLNVKSVESYGRTYQHGTDTHLDFSHLICDANISVLGRLSFINTYALMGESLTYNFSKLERVKTQAYPDVNVFRIRIGSPDIDKNNRAKLSHMLALIFHEMLPTFFPKCSDRIMVMCSDWPIDKTLLDEDIGPVHVVTQTNFLNDAEEPAADEICLYVMEDSAIETGLVNVFWQDEEFRYMLKVIEDYLYFIEMVDREEQFKMFGRNCGDLLHLLRKVLLFVINERSDGTESSVYENSIRVTRDKFNGFDLNRYYDLICDFCKKPIPQNMAGTQKAYHFYHNAGIVCCADCYEKAVSSDKTSTPPYVEDCLRRFQKWLARKYDTELLNPFYCYLEDAEYIARRVPEYAPRFIISDGREYIYVDGISIGGDPYSPAQGILHNAQGIGCFLPARGDYYDLARASYCLEDNKQRAVLIRNGLADDTYQGTLAHETTHQWQYDHLIPGLMYIGAPPANTDEFGTPLPMDRFRYEGHAMWAEIQYLFAQGHPVKAMTLARSTKQRVDVYGVGYRWMCHFIRVFGKDPYYEPPEMGAGFRIKRLWYQITQNGYKLMELYFGNNNDMETDAPDPNDNSSESDKTDNDAEDNLDGVQNSSNPAEASSDDEAAPDDLLKSNENDAKNDAGD